MVSLGAALGQLHLLESTIVEKYITQYPIDEDNIVIKPNYQNGKVFINDTQYFNNLPEVACSFFIGGYPAGTKMVER